MRDLRLDPDAAGQNFRTHSTAPPPGRLAPQPDTPPTPHMMAGISPAEAVALLQKLTSFMALKDPGLLAEAVTAVGAGALAPPPIPVTMMDVKPPHEGTHPPHPQHGEQALQWTQEVEGAARLHQQEEELLQLEQEAAATKKKIMEVQRRAEEAAAAAAEAAAREGIRKQEAAERVRPSQPSSLQHRLWLQLERSSTA